MTECVRHTGRHLWQVAVSQLFHSYYSSYSPDRLSDCLVKVPRNIISLESAISEYSYSFTIGHLAAIIYGNRWNLIRRTDSGWIGSSCDHCYGVGRVWTDEEAGKGIEGE